MDILVGACIAVALLTGLFSAWTIHNTRSKPAAQPKPESPPMQGVGDLVSKVTGFLQIPECGGCKGRKDKLNKMIPFRGNVTANMPEPPAELATVEPPEWIRQVEDQGGDAAAFLAGWLSCQTAMAKMELPQRQVFEACLGEWQEFGRILTIR
uniref:Uncharacterized protein n=1 Tax=viral metagenome TaxID=1070528 RepID=A0A6H1Z9R4_9ZZZZ